ncbi:MAG: hypothetical protein EHM87_00400 [Burkholderiales bacterium]|nr:MAG: hypothetical protein EHM87_00400 [Burkholderiales bacterium]
MDDDEHAGRLHGELERLIAGTLALMTTWYQSPQPAICRKLIDNLTLIGRHEAVSEGMRRICANSAARWAMYLEQVELAIESGADIDGEAATGAEVGDTGLDFAADTMPAGVTLH